MKKRDRRLITPSSTSLTVGSDKSIQKGLDDLFDFCDAVPESMGPSEKVIDTSSAFYLKGEGTSGNKEEEKSESGNKDKHNEIISKDINSLDRNRNPKNIVSVFGPDKKRLKNTRESKAKKWIKQKKARQVKDKLNPDKFAIQLINPPVGKIRVPVVNPDGSPAMPTLSSRARKWIEKGKVKPMRTKTGIFYVQLLVEPSGKEKQDVVLLNDPGSRFTGVAVVSKKAILYGFNLELIADEKKNPFASIKYRMNKRRELRRGRRHRNCRRRPARFDNRSKTGKMAPSIRARKQLELRVNKELCDIYPISIFGTEDVKFDHYSKRWGKNFSQVEVGKKWLYEKMKKLISDVRLIKGFDTNTRRQQLGLEKGSKKEEREVRAHVNDCIAMGSIILGLGIETKNKLRSGINFDIITRPKYSRRKLHREQPNKKPNKKGIRRRFGGTTTNWTNIRKGDYIEVLIDKRDGNDMMYRGWAGGYDNDKKLISLYNFDWEVVGQFSSKNVRLLERNNGLMINSLYTAENRANICEYGTEQIGADGKAINIDQINEMIKMKKKEEKDVIKESNDRYSNSTIQKGIDNAWN